MTQSKEQISGIYQKRTKENAMYDGEFLKIIEKRLDRLDEGFLDLQKRKSLKALADNSERYILNVHNIIEDIMYSYALLDEDNPDDKFPFDKISEMEDLIVEECFRCYQSGILDAIYGAAKQRVVSENPGSIIDALKALGHE
jgi:hypothetical protein